MTEIDYVQLNKFIIEYFDDYELRLICAGDFQDVYNDFTDGMGKKQKVLKLVDWCRRQGKTDDLLEILQRERPKLYTNHFAEIPKVKTIKPQPHTAVKRNPRQIFISHAHEDAELAQRFAHDLEAEGWDVWIAPDSIQPGERWVKAIGRGLDESGVCLLLLTPAAVASKWVQRETNVAIELEHERELQLVPIQVQACKLPALWRSYQRIALRSGYDKAMHQLLTNLNGKTPEQKAVVEAPKPTVTQPRIEVVAQPKKVDKEPQNIRINPISGKEMIRIPAGKFLYGDDKKPVYLDEFWIAKTPVTNVEYAEFVRATNYRVPAYWKDKKPPSELLQHPVMRESWHNAFAYAQWAKCSLPTEQQWEKAARGTDGRIYPWGDELPTLNHCNFGNNVRTTTPVGQYSPLGDSPYGCVDMSGNTWEWTASWYDAREKLRVQRGGAAYLDYRYCRIAFRLDDDLIFKVNGFGFRVVETISISDS